MPPESFRMSWLRSIPFPSLQNHLSYIKYLHPGRTNQDFGILQKQHVPSLKTFAPTPSVSVHHPQLPIPNQENLDTDISKCQLNDQPVFDTTLSGQHTITVFSLSL